MTASQVARDGLDSSTVFFETFRNRWHWDAELSETPSPTARAAEPIASAKLTDQSAARAGSKSGVEQDGLKEKSWRRPDAAHLRF